MLPYYYNNQLKRYIVQFIQIFSGMQVQVGKSATKAERLIPVPIHFSQMDKVSAAIMADNTTNKPVRIPVMSVDLISLRQDPNGFAGLNQIHAQTYLPSDGYFADDVKTIERLRPTQYIIDLDLAIWTSNTDQHFQILEQILPVFNPSIQLQTSDAEFDWTKIATVTLENMSTVSNYPITTNNRVVMSNLTFSLPIYLSAPANLKNEFVRDVFVRVNALDPSASYEEYFADLTEMDESDIPYTKVASADDVEHLAETKAQEDEQQ